MKSVSTGNKRELMRRYVMLALVCGVLGLLFHIYVSYSELGRVPPFRVASRTYSLAIVVTIACGFLVFHADQLLDKLIAWKTSFLLRFLSGFVVNTVMSLAIVASSSIYLFNSSPESTLKVAILFVISIFIYEIFYGWYYSYRYYAITQVEGIRLERQQLELQFESLKNQISPHYLFNCLNTISSLLYKDSHMAEEFIRRMADTFRYVLSNQKQQLVPLRNEIEFVKAYYYLLQVRYEHHLRLEINLPKSILDTVIPPLTIQILVENAVKHNQISKDSPLLVYVSAQDNTRILVMSTKTTTLTPAHSFKIGLENIRARYQFFTNEKVVVKDEDKFVVQLPVIRPAANSTKRTSKRMES